MIQTGTRLRVADNSGAKEIECFRILGRSRATVAEVGDIIVAAVKQATPNAGVKKGDVVQAGVMISNSEVGSKTVHLTLTLSPTVTALGVALKL